MESVIDVKEAPWGNIHDGTFFMNRPADASEPGECGVEGIVGHSASLREAIERLYRVAPLDTTVLIRGETGTGKELFARAVHQRSCRAAHRFVAVNLAAMPKELVAAELFGYEPGAFTGAVHRRVGRFEMAHRGTLFLDEVGELTGEIQVALLRALQEGEVERLGSSQPQHVDVRLIAATNRNLERAIEDGAFRSDLYYRLNVFPIDLPPLRERPEDIQPLAEYFLDRVQPRVHRRFLRGIPRPSIDRLMAYDWPGNIRELENVIERSAILSDGDELCVNLPAHARADGETGTGALASAVDQNERRLIEIALEECDGRVAGRLGAARRLGVHSSTLESKIKRLRIDKLRYRAALHG